MGSGYWLLRQMILSSALPEAIGLAPTEALAGQRSQEERGRQNSAYSPSEIISLPLGMGGACFCAVPGLIWPPLQARGRRVSCLWPPIP
jgi:hypothetical protein